MLLRNESKVLFEVMIKLVFDDDTYKEAVVKEDDILEFKYRIDGNTATALGKIVSINPVILRDFIPPCDCGCSTSCCEKSNLPEIEVIFTVDASTEMNCGIFKVKLSDILDIYTLNSETINPVDPNAPVIEDEEKTEEETPIEIVDEESKSTKEEV